MEILFGRFSGLFYSAIGALITASLAIHTPLFWGISAVLLTLTIIGIRDYRQKQHPVLANYPLFGHFRYIFESIRPEIRQYFFESDDDEHPYSREQRAMVYQRAKAQVAVRPFGSVVDMYKEDHEWLNHSMQPVDVEHYDFRTQVGEGEQAYAMSVLNISGTSFGSLSPHAILALNSGARLAGCAHNTGEGGLSPHHLAGGGNVIWQIASGYFGCRTKQGRFDPEKFREKSNADQVRMIEIKLSQGAKPGHGGILMGAKVTQEIADIRGVEVGKDCVSPSRHSEFSTPRGLLEFAQRLRTLSGGKPVGIKLCIGHPWEFIAIVRAMVDTGLHLDFVTVDGSEGGTGAAPAEFTDRVGSPLHDALIFVDNTLKGAGLRKRVKVGASGKIVSAYDVVRTCALGADWCNMARPFMFALGCIQARDCSSGRCPTGIATMDPNRYRVLDVSLKMQRVANFHHNTLHAVAEMLGAAGLSHTNNLTRRHIVRRVSASEIKLADQIYPKVPLNALIEGQAVEDIRLSTYWNRVGADSFQPIDPMPATP
ncbi:MAG: FMN-binding glutamate synthase family protein [Polynucleobacter sp.]